MYQQPPETKIRNALEQIFDEILMTEYKNAKRIIEELINTNK